MLHFRFLTRFLIGLEPTFILHNPAVNAIDRLIYHLKKAKLTGQYHF